MPKRSQRSNLVSLELCAGAGGQALGLEQAGFSHAAVVELDHHCCSTLKLNRPGWTVIQADIRLFNAALYRGVDLLAGGLPCPPFSKAGKQLGEQDERNLFPAALGLIEQVRPRAIMIENVRGILDPVFEDFRHAVISRLKKLGYEAEWQLLNASDFSVPQLRPRAILVGIARKEPGCFAWPDLSARRPKTVGETLYRLMASNGWEGADEWRKKANTIAPTIVGGSHKHGGPDLGPSRAKKAWQQLGVDAHVLGDAPPAPGFQGMPRLTVEMVALLQGFPRAWKFAGKKTNAYRQVGNAFPPPVAKAVAKSIAQCLRRESDRRRMIA